MDAYIVKGYRTAVGKAPRGGLRFTRPDDMSAAVIKKLMADLPDLPHTEVEDVICGNATPEAEQGLNVGRMISLMGLNTEKVPGMTVNRYCSSGLETIAIASSKIHAGLADCIIAGGVESMSPIPFGGWRLAPNAEVADKHPDWYWGMGLTAEAVAREFDVSREDQDKFALRSNQRAVKAIEEGHFKDEIVPIDVKHNYLEGDEQQEDHYTVDTDEGPRKNTSIDALSKLRPVFDSKGTVTAGNASQTSDGAAFVMVASEAFVKRHHLKPIARLMSYQPAALEPRIMGMGPVYAVPKALEKAGKKIGDIDLVELNEAFASQSLAVIRKLGLDEEKTNVNGGAIALGHPLGCTGAKLSVQLFNAMQKRGGKYGLVTMCVGTGQGAAGVFEMLD